MNLEDAQSIVAQGRMEGVECPCCKRYAKVYRRSINSAMARVLLELFKRDAHHPGAWVKIGKGGLSPLGGDYAKLRWWGLIESIPTDEKREDGSSRVGWWRITLRGRQFVRCDVSAVTVERYVYEFDGEPLNPQPVVGTPETITFEQCFGEGFDYGEIMRSVG